MIFVPLPLFASLALAVLAIHFSATRDMGARAHQLFAAVIALYAVLLRDRHPKVARGLGLGAAVLTVSITMRSLDQVLCGVLPMGAPKPRSSGPA